MELARRLGYDVSYIRKIEWGERRPSEAFRIRIAQTLALPVSTLPRSEAPTEPRRVPEAGDPLIGRESDVAAVTALLDNGARVVTIVGAPGIGKTRLALTLAAQFDDRLAAGARFVPLVDVADAAGVPKAIGQAIGATLLAGDAWIEPIVAVLQSQATLLVLDNFEHVVQAALVVAQLVAQLPMLVVLVTSRQALGLGAETVYGLPPLALAHRPDGPPDRLADVPAIALFVARAQKVRPDFTLDSANAAAVAEICTRLQGIPLAIEMAAGAVRLLSPAALLAEIGHGLDLPVTGPRDARTHHRTLRGAIQWSFELLRPDERTLMRRLAVFAGGCTLDAAEAVCRLQDGLASEYRAGLLALAAKSLLDPVDDDTTGTRYVALEAVRELAMERLRASGELVQVERRYAAWFLQLAEANADRLTGPEQVAALALLDAERVNMRAALRWSLVEQPQTALALCAALWRYWWMRGHLAEGRHWLDAALARASSGPAVRAVALVGAGVLARTQGAYGESLERLEEGARLSRSIDDARTLALALINLGITAEHQGDSSRALELLKESLSLYATCKDNRGVAHCMNCLGTAWLGRGDLGKAAALFEEALPIFQREGDAWSAAMVLGNLGWVEQKQGRSAVARLLYERSLATFRTLGEDRGVAHQLVNLGMASQDPDGATEVAGLFEEAFLLFSCLGERRGMAEAIEALAVALSRTEPAAAAVLLGAAQALRRRIDAPLGPDDRARHDRVVEVVRAELDQRSFDVAWQQGRMMQPEEAVAASLGDRGERVRDSSSSHCRRAPA